MELVQEIHHLLMDREDTCHRTCFSLQLDGITLDNFAELKNIEGLKEGSVIKVIEEPYTVREARIHVRHVRDLLKSLDPADAFNGVDCCSLSFVNTIAQGDILGKQIVTNKFMHKLLLIKLVKQLQYNYIYIKVISLGNFEIIIKYIVIFLLRY